jgi:hypothetical protein
MATITTTSECNVTTDTGSLAMEATTTMGGPVRPLSSKDPVPSHLLEIVDAGAGAGAEPVRQSAHQSLWATTLLITTLCGVTFASSMTTGLLAVAIPTMAKELNIPDGLLLW